MKGYKAFDKGMICRGKQYAENTVFEEEKAKICECGMHFCKNPLAVLGYYPLVNSNGELSEFAEVESLDDPVTNDNEKYCSKKLKIGAKIGFPQLVQASVNFEFEKVSNIDTKVKTTNKNNAQIGSSGDYARIGSSGDYAQIGSSGDYARINSDGLFSVVCCAGHNSIAKAKKGSWIILSEWQRDETLNRWIPKCVKTEYVDGKNIKENTWYKLIDGKFTEVDANG